MRSFARSIRRCERPEATVAVYPEALKSALTRECPWSAEFSLRLCASAAGLCNAAGWMARAANGLVHDSG
ncbi:MAG: hypothetical protein FJW30_21650 [Acidobacteria bacterium]|nr:hypothetical protein [Acidobacteriota bacterium]